MKTWKLTLEYDGSRYAGWAEQTNAPRTILGEVRKACEAVLMCPADVMGAGRTDAGVHARGQVAHLRAASRRRFHPDQLARLINEALPYDIAVIRIEDAPAKFHARHDAIARAYTYQYAIRKGAFSKKFVWWIKDPLNLARMAEAAALR